MKRFLSASPTPSLIEDASPKGAGKSLAASALIHVGILAGIAAILTVSPLQKTESAVNQALQIDLGPGGWASDIENHIAKGVASGTNDGKSVTEPKKGSGEESARAGTHRSGSESGGGTETRSGSKA